MKAYSIFDDYPVEAVEILRKSGIEVTVHPKGKSRPDDASMEEILMNFDIVIIGTSQKLTEGILSKVTTPKIIATASTGRDHIKIPKDKTHLFTVINTPKANAQSVAEYTMGSALCCVKRLNEGAILYKQKKDNKHLFQKPDDLRGKTIGVVGAGNVSRKIMEYAQFFGMNIICWTAHPSKHDDLSAIGVRFVLLEELASRSDVVSVNLPNNADTIRIINADFVARMKKNSIFICVSRLETIDWRALLAKAERYKEFYVCLDIDIDNDVVENISNASNIQVTPHIAGGTIETRKRMFLDVASQVVEIFSRMK